MLFIFRKTLFKIGIGIILLGILGIFIYRFSVEKTLKLISPNGGEVWQAGKTYEIKWKARNVGKIAIVLVSGEDFKKRKWIVKNYPARKKKYKWKIFTWEETGERYRIGIFEYPWEKQKLSDYSDNYFAIVGPQFASCDTLSIENQWPFIPSDYPNLRKVFITNSDFDGNLGGLKGADEKCQEEAEKQGLKGEWKAFLGDDENVALERINKEGIVVEAIPAATLPEGKTCHRLLGKNFDEFLNNFSDSLEEVRKKFGIEFTNKLNKVWIGRISQKTKKECIKIHREYPSLDPIRDYSFTVTCQNWTTNREVIPGYPKEPYIPISFPQCYTKEGKRTEAVGLAGFASGTLGVEPGSQRLSLDFGFPCNKTRKLICVQQ